MSTEYVPEYAATTYKWHTLVFCSVCGTIPAPYAWEYAEYRPGFSRPTCLVHSRLDDAAIKAIYGNIKNCHAITRGIQASTEGAVQPAFQPQQQKAVPTNGT